MNEIWENYVELMTDPAHVLVESTFILVEFMIFTVLLNHAKKVWHRIIDREHGFKHYDDRPSHYKGEHRLLKMYNGTDDEYIWRFPG